MAKVELRTEAYKLFGVEVTQVPGLEMLVLPLFSEVGRDLSSRWPTAAHFVSWLNLCPDNDISGGRVLWKGTRKVQNRAGQIFRIAAYSLHRSPTPLGNYLRRMKSKLGPQAATRRRLIKLLLSSTQSSPNKSNTTKPFGPLAMPNGKRDWKIRSSVRPDN